MTNFSNLRVGPTLAPFQATPANAIGDMPVSSTNVRGMVLSPLYKYSIVPLLAISGGLAAAAVYSGAPASVTLSSISGATQTTLANGIIVYDMGVERAILATGVSAPTAATLVSFTGYDMNLQFLTTTFTGPVSTATVSSPKTMRYVRAGTVSGNSVSGIAFGPADVFGLPYACQTFNDIVALNWTDKVTASTGFTSADTTSPATALTGATRGKYAVQSASDSAKRLTIYICPVDVTTVSGLYGTTPQV